MTIKTHANEFEGSRVFSPVKLSGAELQLLIKNHTGQTLGQLRVTRIESLDITSFTVDAGSRGKAVKNWLAVSGMEDSDRFTRKKLGSRSLERTHAHVSFTPTGEGAYFLNLANEQRYQNLDVLLEPT